MSARRKPRTGGRDNARISHRGQVAALQLARSRGATRGHDDDYDAAVSAELSPHAYEKGKARANVRGNLEVVLDRDDVDAAAAPVLRPTLSFAPDAPRKPRKRRGRRKSVPAGKALAPSLNGQTADATVAFCCCRRPTAASMRRDARVFCAGAFGTLPPGYTTRQKVSIILYGTPAGHAWDIFQTAISVLACALYIASTYAHSTPTTADLVLTLLFLVDYLIRLYAFDNRMLYPFTFHAVIDFLTIVPVFVELTTPADTVPELAFLRFVRVLRVMRILRAFKVINASMSAVSRQMCQLVLTVTSIVFLSAGLVHVVESETSDINEDLTFGDAVYFIVVTMTTVGYGDVVTVSVLGKFIVTVMIILSLVLIPMQVNVLTTLLAHQSKFRTKIKVHEVPHVMLIGHLKNKPAVEDFVMEFFHPDRINPLDTHFKDRNLVMVSPQEPDAFVKRLICNPVLENKLKYFLGSVMHDGDLYGAAADAADACFVIGDPASKDPDQEDRFTILRTLAIMNFNPHIRSFVHLLDVRHKPLIQRAQVTEVVCTNLIKMQLIAQSCTSLGFVPLLYNLLRSMSASPGGQEQWLSEYKQGCALELYSTHLADDLVGLTFLDVATAVYTRFNGEAICWGVLHHYKGGPAKVLLNPGVYHNCERDDKLFITAANMQVATEVAMPGYGPYMANMAKRTKSMYNLEQHRDRDGIAARMATTLQAAPFGPKEVRTPVSYLKRHLVIGVEFSDHIVIAGDMTDIDILVTSLRTKALFAMGMTRKIVLVLDGDLEELTFLVMPSDVYIIQGRLSHVHTLGKCNLSNAHCCILLPSAKATESVDGDVLDTNIIFAYLVIEKFLAENCPPGGPKPYIIANVSSVSNLRVLDSSMRNKANGNRALAASKARHWDYMRAASAATPSGGAASSKRRRSVVEELALMEARRTQERLHQQREKRQSNARRRKENADVFARGGDGSGVNIPFYASGQSFASNTLHTLLCQSFYDPDTSMFVKALLDPSAHNSMLLPYYVPKKFDHKTFGYLFRILIRKGMVAVALYRTANSEHSGYVYTGPEHETRLHAGDRVFVLERPGVESWDNTATLPLSFRTEEPGQKPAAAGRPAARRDESSDDDDGEAEQVFPVSLRSLVGEQVGLGGDANVGSKSHKRAVRFHADEPSGRGKSPASAASEASGPNEDDGAQANGHAGRGAGRDSPIDDDRSTPGAPAVTPKRAQQPRPPATPYSTTPPPPPLAAPAPVTRVDAGNKRAAAAAATASRNAPVSVDTKAPAGLGDSTTTSRRNVLNFGPTSDVTDTPRHLLADMTFTAGGGMSHASMISHLACPAQITGTRSTRALPVQEEDGADASDAPVTFVFNS